ncbi:MAG: tyrosine--tRNA ligase [Armatimonadetes bacterium]|nr:tyrosine--tRNA ligase [Armatimonadota bacterium]
MDFLKELEWRGLLFDKSAGAEELLAKEVVTAYNGFDPTADSLHVGSLLPLVCLARLQRAGHKPLALVGGATGMIGDPSGKTAERSLLTRDEVAANVAGIRAQMELLLDVGGATGVEIVDNNDWFEGVGYIEFLRDIGKHFTVNQMVAKESVKRRMESEVGISYTEFSYMLLQSYDFLKLFETKGCKLQCGGSDQWGNITAGMDLVHRVAGSSVHGITYPLLMNSSGTKFGKSEQGNVWLDPKRTSPYRFYQFWLNTEDRDVISHLKFFTFLGQEEIAAIAEKTESSPELREAQKVLAQQVTEMVHGKSGFENAVAASRVMFGESLANLSGEVIGQIVDDVPSGELANDQIGQVTILDLLEKSGLVNSRGQGKDLLKSGGIYLNNEPVTDPGLTIQSTLVLPGGYIFLRKGKKNYFVFKLS